MPAAYREMQEPDPGSLGAVAMQHTPINTPSDDGVILAPLGYLPVNAPLPVQYTYPPPNGEPWENAGYDRRLTPVRDARALARPPALARHGFTLREVPGAVRDFDDEAAIRRRYYPEMVSLACELTGGRRAIVFDHLVRRRAEQRRLPLDFGRGRRAGAAPVNGRLHNDYTEASGRRRLGLVLNDERARDAVHHYCILNLWRPLMEPVLDAPLALCDARTVSAIDLVAGEVRYPHRTGDIYLLRHSPWHRWYYYSGMRRDEVLVFKQYDTRINGVSRFTPHGAFELPDVPASAPPRASIEVRCLVILE